MAWDPYKLTRSQKAVVALAREALDELWPSVRNLPPVDIQAAVMELTGALWSDYGQLGAAAAAQWYDEVRAEVFTDGFQASPVVWTKLEAVQASTGWAVSGLGQREAALPPEQWQAELDRAKMRLEAMLGRHVMNAGRETLIDNMLRDPRRPRWARVMRGVETCGWCRMLASRGFVYASRESAGETHGWHDRCDCMPMPEFAFDPAARKVYDGEIATLRVQYEDAREGTGLTNPTRTHIVAEWERRMIDYDDVEAQLVKHRIGATRDGTLQQQIWDDYRRDVLARMRRDFPDGYVGTRRLPPRNPAQAPGGWPEDLPLLRAKEWNHALYGDMDRGGHLNGYGWVHGKPEFGADRSAEWVLSAVESVLRRNMPLPRNGRVEGVVDGERVCVSVAVSRGVMRVTSIFPKE